MGTVYGVPSDHGKRLASWLGRGSDRLAAGRSEAAAAVVLNRRTRSVKKRTAGPGGDGLPGLPGAIGLSRGYKVFARSNFTNNNGSQFLLSYTNNLWPSTPPTSGSPGPLTDLAYLSRGVRLTGGASPANTTLQATSTPRIFQMGQGNGRGGFRMVIQFGFAVLGPTRRWFMGVGTGGALTGDPSAFTHILGVGQDSADGNVQFMHNDGSGTATKSSAGMSVAVGTLYEVEILASPFSTNAEMTFTRYAGANPAAVASYDSGVSTDLPTTIIPAYFYANNGSAGGSLSPVYVSIYAELQPWPED